LAEQKRKEELKAKDLEVKQLEAKKAAEKENEAIKGYFKLLNEKNLLKYVGQPKHAQKLMRHMTA